MKLEIQFLFLKVDALEQAVKAAEQGAKDTANIPIARRGRASNLGSRVLGNIDPGAQNVAIIVRAIYSAMSKQQK